VEAYYYSRGSQIDIGKSTQENSCEEGFVKSGIFRSARFEKTKPSRLLGSA
jgi:hypothetical protein